MRYRLRRLSIIEWIVLIAVIFVLLSVWWPTPFPIDFDAPPHRAKSTGASKNEEIGANLSHRGAEMVADDAHGFDQPVASESETKKYANLVSAARTYWESAANREVTVTWNPAAPNELTMRVLIEVCDGELVIFSHFSELEYNYVACFTSTGAVVSDCHLHTISPLPPFYLGDGGTTVAAPAELLAVRLLALTSAIPRLAVFDHSRRTKLTKEEEGSLAGVTFADEIEALIASIGHRQSLLEISGPKERLLYEWLDDRRVLFRAEVKKCDSEVIARRSREFQWTGSQFPKITRPRLGDLVRHLTQTGTISAIDGSIAAVGKSGFFADPETAPRPEVNVELVRIRVGEQIGALSISGAVPVRAKTNLSEKNPEGSDLQVRVVASAEVEDTHLLALAGQDWMISTTLRSAAGQASNSKLISEIAKWLRSAAVRRD